MYLAKVPPAQKLSSSGWAKTPRMRFACCIASILFMSDVSFLFQNAGFSQLSEQPELGKLIALCVGLGLALLRLVLPLLSSKQITQPADEQLTQQTTSAKRRQTRSSQKRTSPIMIVMSLHCVSPSLCFQEHFCCALFLQKSFVTLWLLSLFCYTNESII